MKKIYEQLKDLHVRNIVFYAGDDSKIYIDEALEKQATRAQIEDAFVKGQLLIKSSGGGMFTPLRVFENVVTVVTEDGHVDLNAAEPEAE